MMLFNKCLGFQDACCSNGYIGSIAALFLLDYFRYRMAPTYLAQSIFAEPVIELSAPWLKQSCTIKGYSYPVRLDT